MSIKSKLEEASQCLSKALEGAEDTGAADLQRIIGGAIADCRAALALADPGAAWLERAKTVWDELPDMSDHAILRFAAKIAAGELRKYIAGGTNARQQIADLEAIAKGGGE